MSTGTRRPAAGAAIIDDYDAVLLDLDGVVYIGSHPIPHAADVIGRVRARGVRCGFVTNNAARTPAAVAARLTKHGVPARSRDVVTSAQAASHLLARRLPGNSEVLVIGGPGLVKAVRQAGLRPVRALGAKTAALVQGYAPDVDYAQLAEGTLAVARGLPWIATNRDSTRPTVRGIAPGNGALVEVIRAATGADPEVAGKPAEPLYDEAMLRLGGGRALIVGDRLDTDIAWGHTVGADTLLVLCGVTTAAELLAAPPELRPVYLARDLRTLLVPQPPLVRRDAGWTCGPWTASVRGGELVIEATDRPTPHCARTSAGIADPKAHTPAPNADGADPVAALRALCAASWACDKPPASAAALHMLRM
ncbi:MAG: HAD-IIA family hydrolase [Carbonactinosporaceae bacterium]